MNPHGPLLYFIQLQVEITKRVFRLLPVYISFLNQMCGILVCVLKIRSFHRLPRKLLVCQHKNIVHVEMPHAELGGGGLPQVSDGFICSQEKTLGICQLQMSPLTCLCSSLSRKPHSPGHLARAKDTQLPVLTEQRNTCRVELYLEY